MAKTARVVPIRSDVAIGAGQGKRAKTGSGSAGRQRILHGTGRRDEGTQELNVSLSPSVIAIAITILINVAHLAYTGGNISTRLSSVEGHISEIKSKQGEFSVQATKLASFGGQLDGIAGQLNRLEQRMDRLPGMERQPTQYVPTGRR